jgi:glutamate racemase
VISPIGVFDSGLGGLSVAAQILDRLPNEKIVYFADNAHVPYGERPMEEIQEFALGITRFLLDKGAKAIVMACNMSSAVALDLARERFPNVPILGMIEPGAKAAIDMSNGDPIGVLATTGTTKSGAYPRIIRKIDSSVKVIGQACPKFVPLVESGNSASEEAEAAACTYMAPLIAEGCRTIVLGCTHYPFLRKAIEAAAGSDVSIVDPAEETALSLENILVERNILSPGLEEPSEFYTSGETGSFTVLGSAFLGRPIKGVMSINLSAGDTIHDSPGRSR